MKLEIEKAENGYIIRPIDIPDVKPTVCLDIKNLLRFLEALLNYDPKN